MISAIASIVSSLLYLYLLILLVRVVIDWVQMLARGWRPTGALLVLANLVYGLTDPPLRWLRRVVPALRLGGVGIDLSFLVLFIGISIVQRLLAALG
ncbi:YggT family protein [Actinomyces gerencseriae]|uniref:YggT family protein n=1 Tax=Actinomyces gerencseriae TaxID=52769 RepID=UPI0004262975|nr:YggT family protein [Actinomyces gerencseriae]